MSSDPRDPLAQRLAALSPEQRALLAQRLQQPAPGNAQASSPNLTPNPPANPSPAQMGATSSRAHTAALEGIAIVSAACRLPSGVRTPAQFWRMLMDGVDAVTEVPPERWDAAALFSTDPDDAECMNSRWGGFLQGIDQFDAAFFGISPKEAALMDPQQRLLLETAWEALEAGSQVTDQLAGSATGVFIGAHGHSNDYQLLQLAQAGGIESHASTGSAHSILANRISYLFDWRGPSVCVDTACSSSLVAVHLACQSLRTGESDLALAGGVNLMLLPPASLAFSKLGILSPHGRCRSFDAAADGIARGEGCGVVLLKRLADALRDGDPVLAVIRGSAVNQDGASNGLTAPNGPAQEAVIRRALKQAGLEPHQLGLVETHGTGTALGDPVEVEALARVIGAPRSAAQRCWLGAVKTNIGHLEGAAGIAGLIKAVWCLKHRRIPKNLHFTALNPHITLAGTPLAIPAEAVDWVSDAGLRVAAVSSFGFGGTNAHVVLAEHGVVPQPAPAAGTAGAVAPAQGFTGTPAALIAAPSATTSATTSATPSAAPPEAPPRLLPLSARDATALQELARAHAAALRALPADDADALAAHVHSAAAGRTHHTLRLAVAGTSAAALAQALEARVEARVQDLLEGTGAASAAPADAARAGTVFVYSGQGGVWPGMARELFAHVPAFRSALIDVAARFERLAGWNPIADLTEADAEHAARLRATDVAQPALFALQVALTAEWRALGLTPAAVVGHSVGEVAAAWAAGVLTLDDAVAVVWHRSRLMQAAAGAGRMAQVDLSAAEVQAALPSHTGQLEIAGHNGPASTVVAGEPAALARFLQELGARGVNARELAVDHAFHSVQMAPFCAPLTRALEGLAPRAAVLPLASTVSGTWATSGDFNAAYWARNIREPVRFAQATEALLASGYRAFVEVGPHPALGAGLLATAAQAGTDVAVVGTLRRGQAARGALLASLATLYEAGAGIDWRRHTAQAARGTPWVDLPLYPWQRQRHWLAAPDARAMARHAFGPRTAAEMAPAAAALAVSPTEATRAPITAAYEMVWQPAPPSLQVDLVQVAAEVERAAAAAPSAAAVAADSAFASALETRAVAHAWWALRALGLSGTAGERIDAARLAAFGIAPRHARLAASMLEWLVRAGLLRAETGRAQAAADEDTRWCVTEQSPPPRPDVAGAAGVAEATSRIEQILLDRCGTQLPGVLRGEVEPLTLLFPSDATLPSAATMYSGALTAVLCNEMTAEAVAAVVRAAAAAAAAAAAGVADASAATRGTQAAPGAPGVAPLRVLEVGAGTGGTTATVVPRLPPGTAYTYTDISAGFFDAARMRFAGSALAWRFQTLDIEQPPEDQGFVPGEVDVLIASNIVHATGDLRQTLTHMHRLLAPGGVLVMLETVAPRLWQNLTFGLTSGWWRYRDTALRRTGPLLSTEAWLPLLSETGFDTSAACGAALTATSAHAQALVLARAAAAPDAQEAPGRTLLAGTRWLLVAERERPGAGQRAQPVGSLANSLARRLVDAGASCEWVDAAQVASEGLAALPAAHTPWHGVVHCAATTDDVADAAVAVAGAGTGSAHVTTPSADDLLRVAPTLVQWLAAAGTTTAAPPRLWIVTRGAQAVQTGEALHSPGSAPLWALGRSLALEMPDAWGGLVDLDAIEAPDTAAAALLGELARPRKAEPEDQIAYRGQRRWLARLAVADSGGASGGASGLAITPVADGVDALHDFRHHPGLGHERPNRPVDADLLHHASRPIFSATGSWLIVGGLGSLGGRFAQWLAERGARHLVLTSRSGVATDPAALAAQEARLATQHPGLHIEHRRADITDAHAMRTLFDALRAEGRPVRGVIHAAAHFAPAPLATLEAQAWREALAAKLQGAWTLHELTRGAAPGEIELFLLCSSVTALLGAKGLASYAVGNECLAALAALRAAAGLPATCVDWGTWAEPQAALRQRRGDVAALGFADLDEPAAFALLDRLVTSGKPRQAIAAIDWGRATQAYAAAGARPMLQGLGAAEAAHCLGVGAGSPNVLADTSSPAASQAGTSTQTTQATGARSAQAMSAELAQSLLSLPLQDRVPHLAALVRNELGRVLGMGQAQHVAGDTGFFALGLDSLMAVQLRRRLAARTGLALAPTLTFNHPNIDALATHLLGQLLPVEAANSLAGRAAGAADGAGTTPHAAPADAAATAARTTDTVHDDDVHELLRAELEALPADLRATLGRPGEVLT